MTLPAPGKPARKVIAPRPKMVAPALPGRQAMEAWLEATRGAALESALSAAQQVMYDAWDQTTRRSRVALARKALGISPLCADAYNLLAGEAGSAAEALDLYARGLAAGELALGPEGFEAYAGHFWGHLETRPYMRARHGLALALLERGEEDAALEHFRAMLELNPNDNQGIRYLLLAVLLGRDDTEAVKRLLASYGDEWSTHWAYTRALLAYREGRAGQAATLKLLRDARSINAYVPAILAGTRAPDPSRTGYITVGGADEATEYVRSCGAAWERTPGAIEWLATTTGRRRTSKSAR